MSVPEDSTLRRHYLTELKYQQEKNMERFMNQTIPQETIIYAEPFWSKGVLIPAIAFLFFLAVIFI